VGGVTSAGGASGVVAGIGGVSGGGVVAMMFSCARRTRSSVTGCFAMIS